MLGSKGTLLMPERNRTNLSLLADAPLLLEPALVEVDLVLNGGEAALELGHVHLHEILDDDLLGGAAGPELLPDGQLLRLPLLAPGGDGLAGAVVGPVVFLLVLDRGGAIAPPLR